MSEPVVSARRICSCPRCVALRRQVAAARVMAMHASPAYAALIDQSTAVLSAHEAALNAEWDISSLATASFPIPFQRFLLTGELPALTPLCFMPGAPADAPWTLCTPYSLHAGPVTPLHEHRDRCFRSMPVPVDFKPIFIVGCGRSGTTLLTSFFAAYPCVVDLNEARAVWLDALPCLDVWSAASAARGGTLVVSPQQAGTLATAEVIQALRSRLFAQLRATPRSATVLVEKSPENAFRLGLLTAAFPGCRIVHITRAADRVAASIATFSPDVWYGPTDAKWTLLSEYVAWVTMRRSVDPAEGVARVAAVCSRLGDMRARGRVERFAAVACARAQARQLRLLGDVPPPPTLSDLPRELLDVIGDVPATEDGEDAATAGEGVGMASYMEVAFEELVLRPRETWARVAAFCGLEVDGSAADADAALEAVYAGLKRDKA